MGKKIHQPLLQKAIIFAAQKHEGQVRKEEYGKKNKEE